MQYAIIYAVYNIYSIQYTQYTICNIPQALGVLLYKLCYFITPFDENTLAIARAKYTMPDTASRYSDNLLSVISELYHQDL